MSVLSSRHPGMSGVGANHAWGGKGGRTPLRSGGPLHSPGAAHSSGDGHGQGGSSSAGGGDGDHSGWLIKAAPRLNDEDKLASVGRSVRRAAHSLAEALGLRPAAFKRRFCVLDGHELRYYTDESCSSQAGSVDLGTVYAVRWADRANSPAFAFDLVTDARVFTFAPSPASEAAAGEWFKWLSARVDGARSRGMLSRSLRGAALAGARGAAARRGAGDAAGASEARSQGRDLFGPTYLSHEACTLPADVLAAPLQLQLLPLAGGGAGGSAATLVASLANPPVSRQRLRGGRRCCARRAPGCGCGAGDRRGGPQGFEGLERQA